MSLARLYLSTSVAKTDGDMAKIVSEDPILQQALKKLSRELDFTDANMLRRFRSEHEKLFSVFHNKIELWEHVIQDVECARVRLNDIDVVQTEFRVPSSFLVWIREDDSFAVSHPVACFLLFGNLLHDIRAFTVESKKGNGFIFFGNLFKQLLEELINHFSLDYRFDDMLYMESKVKFFTDSHIITADDFLRTMCSAVEEFVLAHELGHIILDHYSIGENQKIKTPLEREFEADAWAMRHIYTLPSWLEHQHQMDTVRMFAPLFYLSFSAIYSKVPPGKNYVANLAQNTHPDGLERVDRLFELAKELVQTRSLDEDLYNICLECCKVFGMIEELTLKSGVTSGGEFFDETVQFGGFPKQTA